MSALRSRNEMEEKVREMAHLNTLLGCAIATRDQAVLDATEKHQPLINEINDDLATAKGQIEQWALANRDAFGEAQSLDLPHGILRFRWTPPALALMSAWTWPKVLKRVRDLKWVKYLRPKVELNRQQLLADAKSVGGDPVLNRDKLRELGLKLESKEAFELEFKPEGGT